MQDLKIVDNYHVTTKVLGVGSFGKVVTGYPKNSPASLVAVKIIPLESIKNNSLINKLIRRELEIL